MNKFDALGKEVVKNNTEIHTINNLMEQPKQIQEESTKKWVARLLINSWIAKGTQ